MKLIKYNKLVRDHVPDIIIKHGGRPVTRTLDAVEFRHELRKKLQEEVTEFYEAGRVEELADILEVVYALAKIEGVSEAQLDELRRQKLMVRGGFSQRILLIETISPPE